MKSVELIPLAHVPFTRAFEEVLEFIKSLPKNHVVGFEISPVDLASPERIQTLNPYGKATLQEIILDCQARNITIIPLESHQLVKKRRSAINAPLEERRRLDGQRESIMIRKIIAALKDKKIRDFVAIVGLGHTPQLQTALEQEGITCTIKTSIFGKKTRPLLEKALKLYRGEQEALLKKDYPMAREIEGRLTSLTKQALAITREKQIGKYEGDIVPSDLDAAKKAIEMKKRDASISSQARVTRKLARKQRL